MLLLTFGYLQVWKPFSHADVAGNVVARCWTDAMVAATHAEGLDSVRAEECRRASVEATFYYDAAMDGVVRFGQLAEQMDRSQKAASIARRVMQKAAQ